MSIFKQNSCFIVAEIGINHNGDLDLAYKMILAAKQAGADAVKFQNYHTEDFILDHNLTYTYESQGQQITEAQYDMFKRYELSKEQLRKLKTFCDQHKILFFSTPTSEVGLAELIDLDVQLLKNGSDYLTHLPLIEAMARTGLPTVLSTGMATLEEIDQAVHCFRAAGSQELILLHCTSAYPTPVDEVNLRKIQNLQKTFNCPIGFSDHTEGYLAAVGSVVLGACMVEKHFTLDKALPGPDHRFSADPQEFAQLVAAICQIEQNLGSPSLQPTPTELRNRASFRLSCVAARDLQKGTILKKEHIQFSRPGSGIAPKNIDVLLGKELNCDLKAGSVVLVHDLK